MRGIGVSIHTHAVASPGFVNVAGNEVKTLLVIELSTIVDGISIEIEAPTGVEICGTSNAPQLYAFSSIDDYVAAKTNTKGGLTTCTTSQSKYKVSVAISGQKHPKLFVPLTYKIPPTTPSSSEWKAIVDVGGTDTALSTESLIKVVKILSNKPAITRSGLDNKFFEGDETGLKVVFIPEVALTGSIGISTSAFTPTVANGKYTTAVTVNGAAVPPANLSIQVDDKGVTQIILKNQTIPATQLTVGLEKLVAVQGSSDNWTGSEWVVTTCSEA
eukprot:Platyproteum_vivax@DN7665_c1_g2_i2.p1